MELLTKVNSDAISKPEIEYVEQQKQEYYLIGSFIRTRGLRMFGYNWIKNELFEVKIQFGNTIHLIPMDGKLIPFDFDAEKCTVDSRFEYFEALNYKSASERLNKYQQGKIKILSNLKRYNPDGIKFF